MPNQESNAKPLPAPSSPPPAVSQTTKQKYEQIAPQMLPSCIQTSKESSADASGSTAMYNFTSSVVSSIAWPVTILIILLIFRKQLIELTGCLVDFARQAESIKVSKDGITLSREIGEVQEQAERALPTYKESIEASEITQARNAKEIRDAVERESGSAQNQAHRFSILMEWAERAPHLAVLDAWRSVEIAAKASLRKKDNNISDATVGRELGELLFKAKALNADQLAIFHKLRRIRNEVSHGASQPWAEDAREYVRLADSLARQIEKS